MEDGIPWGFDLLCHHHLWEAHEVWEGVWHAWAPGPRREGLQGCIQCAATLLLRHLGRPRAMRLQAGRARGHLGAAVAAGVDVGGLDPSRMLGCLEEAVSGTAWPRWEVAWIGA